MAPYGRDASCRGTLLRSKHFSKKNLALLGALCHGNKKHRTAITRAADKPLVKCIWGVSRQLSQRAARDPQIVLFLTHVYDTKMYLKKLFDKRFRRIFSSAFQ